MKKFLSLFLVLALVFALPSCQNKKYNIPPGFIGKVITPTGFEKEIRETGQVDLGEVQSDGQANSLVLLEATTITVKEPFAKDQVGEDHRIKLKDGYVIADIYVQFALPTDPLLRENAFACVTATADTLLDSRVATIKLEDIYAKFAKMNVRAKSRLAFNDYKNADDVMNNLAKVEGEVAKIIAQVIKDSKAPIELTSVSISNVKEDETIVESKNKTESASNEVLTIDKIGQAIRNNPQYVEYYKWQVISEVMAKNPNAVLIIDAGKGNVNINTGKK